VRFAYTLTTSNKQGSCTYTNKRVQKASLEEYAAKLAQFYLLLQSARSIYLYSTPNVPSENKDLDMNPEQTQYIALCVIEVGWLLSAVNRHLPPALYVFVSLELVKRDPNRNALNPTKCRGGKRRRAIWYSSGDRTLLD